MEIVKVLVLGNRNVGKTSLINACFNSSLKVGNFRGTTVETAEIFFTSKNPDSNYLFIDTPGLTEDTYLENFPFLHINKFSKDVQITLKQVQQSEEFDVILLVLDAKYIKDSANEVASIKMLGKPVVICVNYLHEVKEQGYEFDVEKFAKQINVKAIAIDDITNLKRQNLLLLLKNAYNSRFDIESEKLEYKSEIISIEKAIASSIVNRSPKINKIRKYIYNLTRNKVFGIPIFVLSMVTTFYITFTIGGRFASILSNVLENIVNGSIALYLEKFCSNGICTNLQYVSLFFLQDGVLNGLIVVLELFPQIATLMICIAILESIGYIETVIYLLDRFMRKLGLSGESVIVMTSGFGCLVPAYMSSRIIADKRIRFFTLIATSFMPCNAKLILYTMFTLAFFPHNSTFAMSIIYLSSISIGILAGKVTSLFYKESEQKNLVSSSDSTVDEFTKSKHIKDNMTEKTVSILKNTETIISNLENDQISNIDISNVAIQNSKIQNNINREVFYRMPKIKYLFNVLKNMSKSYAKNIATVVMIATVSVWMLSHCPVNLKDKTYFSSIMELARYKIDKTAFLYSQRVINDSAKDMQSDKIDMKMQQIHNNVLHNSILGKFSGGVWFFLKPIGFDLQLTIALVASTMTKDVFLPVMKILYFDNAGLHSAVATSLSLASVVSFLCFIMISSPCLSSLIVFSKEIGSWKKTVCVAIIQTVFAWCFAWGIYKLFSIWI